MHSQHNWGTVNNCTWKQWQMLWTSQMFGNINNNGQQLNNICVTTKSQNIFGVRLLTKSNHIPTTIHPNLSTKAVFHPISQRCSTQIGTSYLSSINLAWKRLLSKQWARARRQLAHCGMDDSSVAATFHRRVWFNISNTSLSVRWQENTQHAPKNIKVHSLEPRFAGVWRTKLRRIWATTAFRSLPSAADTYVQSTSINWLYRAVGEFHSAIGLSWLQARWSGTHYRPSLAISLSVLAFFGALLRQYYSRDISASSTIYPWYCAI